MPWCFGIPAAQEEPDAIFEKVAGDLPFNGLVGIRYPARGTGRHEFAAVNVAAHRPTPFERRAKNRVTSRVPERDGNIVHFFPERYRLGPAVKNPANFRRREIAARRFQF